LGLTILHGERCTRKYGKKKKKYARRIRKLLRSRKNLEEKQKRGRGDPVSKGKKEGKQGKKKQHEAV